jgi:Predicted transcriptional regulator with C-terminal CBS domains
MIFNEERIAKLKTADELFDERYGMPGTSERNEFEAKAKAWYYAEILRDTRKKEKVTQKQLAEKIGKKREYIALLEQGKTDMQLSTFLRISEALGLNFTLV